MDVPPLLACQPAQQHVGVDQETLYLFISRQVGEGDWYPSCKEIRVC